MQQLPFVQANQLSQFVSESLPTAALLHSFLVDLNWDPLLGNDQSLATFSENAQHELHHLAALGGALARLTQHDPKGWSMVGLNLARLLYRRRVTLANAARFSPDIRQDPRGRSILALVEQEKEQIQPYLPLIRQTIIATGWQSAAPGVFGNQQ